MPASPSAQGSSGIRAALVDEVIAIRDKMVGPDGSDPALSRGRGRGIYFRAVFLGVRSCCWARRCCWPRRNEWITKRADVSSGICSRCPLWAVIAVQLR